MRAIAGVAAPEMGLQGSSLHFQASHSRAPLAVGVVRSEPVIPDRVSRSLSPHAGLTIVHCAQTVIVTPPPEPSLLLPPAHERKKSNHHALRS